MLVAIGNFFFRFRTSVSPLLLLLLFLPGPAIFGNPLWAAIAGLVVAGLGQIIRGATIGLDYIVRGGRNHRVYADNLVTEGLFRHSRNPLYVGKFLMALGLGIAANRWSAALALTFAYSFMYHTVVLAEEAYLRNKFGADFDAYCRQVPRWWPRLSGLRDTFSSFTFNWKRVMTKEYSAPLGWVLPITLIGLWNLRDAGGAPQTAFGQPLLISLLVITVLFWFVAGWMKKSGRTAPAEVS